MLGKDLVRLLKKNGWEIDRIQGSHYVMKKGSQTETIPVHNKIYQPAYLTKFLREQGLNSPCSHNILKGGIILC